MALQVTGGSSCLLLLPLLLLLLSLTSGASAVDLTLQRDAAGSDVVRSVLARLSELDSSYGTTTITAVDRQLIEQFIREMAYVETRDGEDSSEGGIWGVSRELFQQTKQYNNPRLFSTISSISCIDWASVSYDDLRTPLHSGLAIRIHLFSLYGSFGQRLQATATDEGKAQYWIQYFSGTSAQLWVTRTQQLRRSEVCSVDTDIVFVVDSSGSIGSSDYQLVRDYVYSYASGLLNGNSNSRVGVILFSSSANIEIPLSNTTSSVLQRIANLRYIDSGTNIPEGLCLLRSLPWRRSTSVLRIAIMLTDGKSSGTSSRCLSGTLAGVANEIHNLDPPVTVFAVGVGSYDRQQLLTVASDPQYVDELSSFNSQLLQQNQRSRTDSICFKESQPVSIGARENGTLGMGSVSRLQFSASGDDGVTARVCINRGEATVYGSLTVPNPNTALYDFSQVLKGDCGNFFGSIQDARTAQTERCISNNAMQSEAKLYLTIEGMSSTETQYSIDSSHGNTFGGCTLSVTNPSCGGISVVIPVVASVVPTVVLLGCVVGVIIVVVVVRRN